MKKLIPIILIPLLGVGLFFALDTVCHVRQAKNICINRQGFRGEVLGKKQKDEYRILMLGGSYTFGYGVKPDETIPALLQKKLGVTVINGAYNNEGAYAFSNMVKDFEFLDYDAVVILTGYNDGGDGNDVAYRHRNWLFSHFHYMPVVSLVLTEKMLVLRYGNIGKAYKGNFGDFKPRMRDDIIAKSINFLLKATNWISRETEAEHYSKAKYPGEHDWYKHFLGKTIAYCLYKNRPIIIIGEPHLLERHVEQQRQLREYMKENYPKVPYIDLGWADKNDTFDGMHLTKEGCEKMADKIAGELKDIIKKDASK